MADVSESAAEPDSVTPPTTGIPEIDQALAAVDLSGPISDHPVQFAAAVEALHKALRNQ